LAGQTATFDPGRCFCLRRSLWYYLFDKLKDVWGWLISAVHFL
jgi:hypothetical protein